MADKKIGVGVVVDASEAQDGFKRVGEASREMAKVVKQSGVEAGKGLDGVGAGGDEAAAKLDRATKSIINSIQRTTTQLEAGGKASSKYYELLASQRNINVDALKPYIDQLKAVEGAQSKVGISAAQTAAAMRSVPAQFTDIITSLQGGQQPLTVFIQQGGQLKDMFGGIAPAAKAIGGYILGLVNPLTVSAAAVAGLAYAYSQANEQSKAFARNIITSGNAAGATVDQLNAAARRLSDVGVGSQSAAADALGALVSSGGVSMSMLDQAARVAIRNQELLGISVQDTVKAFADLAGDPTKAIESLNTKYHFLTLELYEQIKALQDQGKKAEAAALAQQAYADALNGQAAKVNETLSDWERGWVRIKNAVSNAYGATKQFFADDTAQTELEKLMKERDKLEASQKRLANDTSWINQGAAERVQKLLDQNKALINLARDKISADERAAKAEEAKNKQVQAGIQWSDIVEKNLTKQQKLEQEITKARNIGIAAGKSQAEIEKEVATIRQNGAEKAKKAIEDQSLAWQVSKAEAKAWGKAQKDIYDDLIKSQTIFADSVKKNTKDIVAGFADQWQAENRLKASLDDWARGYQESADLAKLELSLLGQSSVERATALAQYKVELDLQKQLAAIERERTANKISDAGAEEAKLKAQQIAAEAKNLAGIKAQQDEWTKFYTDIYNGLSESLYRGFEAGKGFFQSFWDGIKNLFKTTVLKLAIQGVVGGVMGGLAGSAGASTLPAAITSGANLSQVGKSIYDGFSLAASAGAGVSAIGNLLGSSAISAFGAGMGLSSSAASAAAGAYSAAGMSSTASAISAGSVVGTALPWVAGAALLYKGLSYGDKQMSGQTITGNLGTNDLMRNVSWTQKGGFLRSDRSGVWSYGLKNSTAIQDGKAYQDTANVANDSSMLKFLNDSYAAIKTATEGFAKTLGLNADEIAKRNDAINVTLGSTKEETDAAIKKALGGIADSIAASLLPNFKDLAKEGETAAGTLARVAVSFGSVNTTLGNIGLKLFQLNDAGIKAASSFADLFGGLEGLQTASAAYYDNFFSQEEKTANALKAVGAEFDKLSLGTLPSTRAEYRKLVEDISKTGNAEQLAGLLKLSGAFAAVVPDAQAVVEKVDQTNDALSRFTSATDAAAAPVVKVASAMDAASEAAQKAATILAERNNLQDQIDAATMTSAQLLEKQRNALDESNRAKFDELQVALATKQAADALAQTNKGILDQIDALVKANETIEQARARELKGVDESTAALKRRLYALQDEAKTQADLKARQDASAASTANLIDAVVNASQATQKTLKSLVDNMTSARDALLTGAQSGFSVDERLSILKNQIANANAADLPGIANNYLQALKDSGVGSVDYQREFASIVNRLDSAATDAQKQYDENVVNEPARLRAWADLMIEQQRRTDLRDALNAEYATYARELPTLPAQGVINSQAWGTKLVDALDGLTFNRNSLDTTEQLLAEIKVLRQASEKTAALLDSVTAGGNAMLTEGA